MQKNMRTFKILLLSLTGLFFIISSLLITIRSRYQTRDDPAATENSLSVSSKKIIFIEDDFGFKGEKIIIELEQHIEIEKPVTVIEDPAASGGRCIEIKEGAGKPPETGGKVVSRFSIAKDAEYQVWGRRWWMDACGNSFTFSLKGDNPVLYKTPASPEAKHAEKPHIFGDDASYNPVLHLAWKWTKGNIYTLKKGVYTITIENREDGVRLDQILLVEKIESLYEYTPVGIEELNVSEHEQ